MIICTLTLEPVMLKLERAHAPPVARSLVRTFTYARASVLAFGGKHLRCHVAGMSPSSTTMGLEAEVDLSSPASCTWLRSRRGARMSASQKRG
eukprot:1694941-Pleurochrysis_carterae.AAC.2